MYSSFADIILPEEDKSPTFSLDDAERIPCFSLPDGTADIINDCSAIGLGFDSKLASLSTEPIGNMIISGIKMIILYFLFLK